MKPAVHPRVEKTTESSLPTSSPAVEKNIPKISGREGAATSVHTERDPENKTEMSLQKSESTSMPVLIKATTGVSDSASAYIPLTCSFSSTPPEISEHPPSIGTSTTVVAKTDLLNKSNSNDNDEKHGKMSQSLLQNQVLPSLLFIPPAVYLSCCSLGMVLTKILFSD